MSELASLSQMLSAAVWTSTPSITEQRDKIRQLEDELRNVKLDLKNATLQRQHEEVGRSAERNGVSCGFYVLMAGFSFFFFFSC